MLADPYLLPHIVAQNQQAQDNSINIILLAVGTFMSILAGGMAMAWRQGRVEQSVHDLRRRIDELVHRIEQLTNEPNDRR